MSIQKPQVTLVGLGLVGASIGLALRRAGVASLVVGHDRDPAASSKARKLGAVDRTEWHLIRACEKSDLVILALPAGEIQETLQHLGPHLQSGCVVLDTASLKAPVLKWADELLPEGIHFVGGDPILCGACPTEGGVEGARADLFEKGFFCVMPSPRADSGAIKLATDLIAILGARPLFYDPAEHDGLMAAVDQLPALLALALLETVVGQPVWRELCKLAGPSFEASTRLGPARPAALSQLCLLNGDNLVRWLDAFVDSLESIRETLSEGEGEMLAQRFDEALKKRDEWLRRRAEATWDEISPVELPRPNLLQPFLGGWVSRKPKRAR